MAFTPILASDMTAALLPFVILFWIGIASGTLAGLLALALYGCKRVQRVWGIILGLFSLVVGAGSSLWIAVPVFILGPVEPPVEWWVWAGVLTPLVVGILDVIIWKNRKYEN